MALTSLANVKAYLGDTTAIATPLSASDALLTALIDRVSTWFERQVGYGIEEDTYTDTIIHDGSDWILTRNFPISDVTAITTDGVEIPEAVTSSASGWHLINGMIWLRDYYVPDRSVVEVEYTAGYAADAIPADIEQAVIELVALKFRERGHVGTASQSQAGVSVSFLPSLVPLSVRGVIEGYRRVSM